MAVCPKCKNDITEYCYHGIRFQLCKSCNTLVISEEDFEHLAKRINSDCSVLNFFSMPQVKAKEDDRFCSKCSRKMTKIYQSGVLLDRCDKCHLIVFDNGELSKYFSQFSPEHFDIMNNAMFIKTYCKEAVPAGNENKTESEPNETNKGAKNQMKIQCKEVEKVVPYADGILMLLTILVIGILILLFFFNFYTMFLSVILVIVEIFLLTGFRILEPQEALVFTLFGKYYGTLKNPGFYWVLPLASSVPPFQKISLKARTLDNGKQKINDVQGNPIEVGIIVTWEVRDTAKAMFNVENYTGFLSAQCDSALRNIVRLYPYDAPEDSNVQSLKGDSAEISEKLKLEIQERVTVAGLNIIDARITHLAYSQEIAVAMLQRQQANAVLDAKKAIVEGAVGMVEMAIDRLSKNENITLDEKTKASMVNNLLVVLCSSRESQPVIRNDLM